MSLIEYDVSDGVGHIRLNRPEVSNAFDLDTARAMASVFARARADVEAGALLVTGSGARFCAGGDVESFAAAEDQPAYVHELATVADSAFRTLAAIEKPVVASVQGAVAGAGLALMLSCDLVVSAPSTKFVFAYPRIGFTPDCGVSYLLPRAVGQQRALAFALGGEPITAAAALEWGMVTEVADDAYSRAQDLARRLARGPAIALGQVRRLLRQSWDLDRVAVGAEEARTITEMVRGPEAQARIKAFVTR